MKKKRRLLILLVQISVVLGVLGVAGTVGFLEYSAQPGFCNNCHNMEPYYESWLKSSHNMVACIKCHYAPGIKAEAMGKVQAANQVVKYVTRTYSEKPWAEIEDAACTREGCHLEQRLGVVSYLGVRFDHAQHLGELRRGKDLRCTSCHSAKVRTRQSCLPSIPVGLILPSLTRISPRLSCRSAWVFTQSSSRTRARAASRDGNIARR